MTTNRRIAVLGLYRSGSTAVAGILHHLGVNMGPPFFGGYFESDWLSSQLRQWWNEPCLEERTSRAERVRVLTGWVREREQTGAAWVGMKHPLLSLCGEDLLEAWGDKTHFVWCQRPFEESLASLQHVKWGGDKSEFMQRTLWTELERFFAGRQNLQIQFSNLMSDPSREVRHIITALDMRPSDDQIADAIRFVEPGMRAKVEQELQPENPRSAGAAVLTGFIRRFRQR